MKIVLAHNFYQLPGGEDQVFADEAWLLEQHGHEVVRYEKKNSEIEKMGKLDLAFSTIWNRKVLGEFGDLLEDIKPDVVHFHNIFPLISPAAYLAAKRLGIPVVQTLHNFRMICPGAALMRDGKICENCVGKSVAWSAIRHKCYRNSRSASTVVALGNAFHHLNKTWIKNVDSFIALTEHSRQVFAKTGIAAEKLTVKPNFVRPDPGVSEESGEYAIFVGRLSPEKGIDVLLQTWGGDNPCSVPLVIIGDGPLNESVANLANRNPNVTWLGQLPFEEVLARIRGAKMLIMPSIWYETFGRTMIEAFAVGVPVIASDIGAMKEIVVDGCNGLHFEVGNVSSLLAKVTLLDGNPDLRQRLGQQARETFQEKYTMEKNYELLWNIYESLQGRRTT